ncbi:MAG: carbon starvation protein A [Deferribacteraceae bacterium]|jgi:carbon starvation protein|nr:carbon starvation protein A [Deferribacteraceae bacterium]
MNGLLMLLISFVIFLAAYMLYGRWLAKKWGVDPKAPTPAHTMKDGVDYVPANKSVVFGHQFASIAGAGPINGPIIAAMFGWLPVLLWIIFGGIFFGAVQDFASMYASVKNKGKTIGYIIELYIGKTGKRLFLIFTWLFSILVVAAFADIVAVTFNGFAADNTQIVANASVATTSICFIIAALLLGALLQKLKLTGYISAAVAIGFLVVCIAIGLNFPLFMAKGFWLYFVFAYIFVASVMPVWMLLQPRDYLNAFLLVFMIVAAFAGVIIANPEMNLPAFTGFEVNNMPMFPILFVTVACGAVSGFHALVSSGTASKQVNNERDMLPISFGGMLLECILAVLALVAVGALAVNGKVPAGSPPTIFAQAIAGFLTSAGLPEQLIFTLITLAVSAFALTSLDSVARVGRLAFQELFTDADAAKGETSTITKVLGNRFVATFLTLFMAYLLAQRGYQNIWPLFGSANQLLAALALIACAVFLKSTKREGRMMYPPMLIMLCVTFTALGLTIYTLISKIGGDFAMASDGLQLIFAVLLLGLGVLVAASGIKKLSSR